MSTLITFLCIAALAAFVYRYAPGEHERGPFRPEQFRPAAPLAGILDAAEARRPDEPRPQPSSSIDQSSISRLD
ncbi:hypothetical protein AB4Z09_22880 [Rhodococcus sp. TAF43]|uniref:hypothetical protein n=1 Tax=Rhodococcus sp. TAF43 TaxID=3237483 RepID=UPI003F9CAD98